MYIQIGPLSAYPFLPYVRIEPRYALLSVLAPLDCPAELRASAAFRSSLLAWPDLEEYCRALPDNAYVPRTSRVVREFIDRPVLGVPGHEEQVFSFRGKAVFDLDGMLGADEVVDHSAIDIPIDHTGSPIAVVNRFSETKLAKSRQGFRYRALFPQSSGLVVHLPFVAESLRDVVVEATHGPLGYAGDRPDQTVPLAESGSIQQFYWHIEAHAPAVPAGASADVSFRIVCNDPAGTRPPVRPTRIFIYADRGYLPRREVMTDNEGRGTVRITALGLEAGERIKLKFNATHYTALGKVFIPVV
jgi:hypothetical protein